MARQWRQPAGRFHDADELRPLGMERLKEALEALGMKCGGTLEQRADRLFSVKGKAPHEIDPKLKVSFDGFTPSKGRERVGGKGGGGRSIVMGRRISNRMVRYLPPR